MTLSRGSVCTRVLIVDDEPLARMRRGELVAVVPGATVVGIAEFLNPSNQRGTTLVTTGCSGTDLSHPNRAASLPGRANPPGVLMMKVRPTALSSARAIAGFLAAVCILAPAVGAQATKSAKKTTAKKAAAKAAPTPELPMRFVVTPTGNEARYRVREQLLGANLPNDAIGTTTQVSGSILAYADGRIVKDSSKIVVTITTLKSDKDRRDGYVQRRTMETEKYPTVEFVPTSVRGFKGSLPASGPVTFELLGELTVHGSTHPAVWQVTAHAEGQEVAGSATTAFTFKDINLDQPKVPIVLSVADTVKLEYDFRFTRPAAKP